MKRSVALFLAAVRHALESKALKNVPIKDLEAKAQVSHGYLRTLERGKRVPRLDVVDDVCEALGIQLDIYSVGPDPVSCKPTKDGTVGYDVYIQDNLVAEVRKGAIKYQGSYIHDVPITQNEDGDLVLDPTTNGPTAYQQLAKILEQQINLGRQAQLLHKNLFPQSESCK